MALAIALGPVWLNDARAVLIWCVNAMCIHTEKSIFSGPIVWLIWHRMVESMCCWNAYVTAEGDLVCVRIRECGDLNKICVCMCVLCIRACGFLSKGSCESFSQTAGGPICPLACPAMAGQISGHYGPDRYPSAPTRTHTHTLGAQEQPAAGGWQLDTAGSAWGLRGEGRRDLREGLEVWRWPLLQPKPGSLPTWAERESKKERQRKSETENTVSRYTSY